jgi:hypothetical protein
MSLETPAYEVRKMILCALARNELDKAKAVFYAMPESGQTDLTTKYLMFKVAIRSIDESLALDCLDAVSSVSVQNLDILYACVLEAHQVGDKVFAIAAMKKLVQRQEFKASDSVHLPALLRCTIRLLYTLEEHEPKLGESGHEDVIEDICTLFEGGKTAAAA